MSEKDDNNSDLNDLLSRLRPFQKEAFNFATKSGEPKEKSKEEDANNFKPGRILLADEMGLGKTVTSLAIMLAFKSEWPLLILCPASLRFTWPAEIEKFCPKLPPSATYIVRGFDDCHFYSNQEKRARTKIVIATYSLLQNRSAAARALQQFNFKCVIADESHNLKEKKSQRASFAMPILMKAVRVLLLSGTPSLAKPVELWPQLYCINQDLFGSYTNFTKRFCNARRSRFGWDCTGLSNADELHKKLKSVMIRRLKADVLSELPPKQRCIVPVKIQKSNHIKECKELISKLNETRASVSSLVGDDASNANFEARSLLMQAYKASGCGKAQAVADYVLDWLRGSGSQKLILFAHHKDVLDTIEEAVSRVLKGVGHIRIDGAVNPKDRASRVKSFQKKPQVRLALLSITAAGVGLTLTAASSVIFAELHWTPGVLSQAEDRAHRIGQKNAVNIMFCVCKDTEMSVDLALWKMLGRKVNNLGRIIDGKRGASMNATEAENNAPMEDQQLASFFAENLGDALSEKSNAPAKGSIQSFFKKPSPPPKLSRTNADSSKIAKTIKITATKCPKRSFACNSCTYINELNSLSCEMCGTIRDTKVKRRKICTVDSNSEHSTFSPVNDLKCTVGKRPAPNAARFSRVSETPQTKLTSHSCVIEISDDSDSDDNGESINIVSPSQPLVIEITNDDADDYIVETKSGRPSPDKASKEQKESHKNHNIHGRNDDTEASLSFSVSKNSGRIFLHNSSNCESLRTNFDLDQILVSEDVPGLQLKRSSSGRSAPQIAFDDLSVKSVALGALEKNMFGSPQIMEKYCSEIKSFASNYVALREVEKKAIKEFGAPILHNRIHDTLQKIISSEVRPQCTDRYTRGRFEKALHNAETSNATEADKRILDGNACAWCGGNMPDVSFLRGVESTYCSQECAEEGRLKRGGMFASTRIRSQVFSLEHGICQLCGIDSNALFLRVKASQPAERLSILMGAKWRLPKTSKSVNKLLQNPKEGDFWQADHIKAVAEGGGSCGLENLRTLCTPCHQIETEKLRSRLKLNSGDKKKSQGTTDIRNFLFRPK